MSSIQLTLENTVSRFLDHQLANDRSPHTIGAHQRDLRLLVNYLGHDITVTNINPSDLDSFFLSNPVTHQIDGHLKKPTSINRTRATIKGFFRWLTDIGQINHNPAGGIRIKRNTSKLPIFLTEDEKRILLKTIRSHKGLQARRDLIIVTLFLHTGIRLSELVNLDIGDINLIEKQITIRAKGGQIVNRFLNTKVRTILHRYLKERKKVFVECQALFLSQMLSRITTRQVQRRLDQWITKAGINKRVTPHSLRHSFATGLYARTSNLLAVQQALGHASVTSTQIYSHLLDESLEEALETL